TLPSWRAVIGPWLGAIGYADFPNLCAERARARAASVSRSRGPAVVTREAIRFVAAAEISATARSNAASLIFEGALKPLNLRTNCREAFRISSSVAGGSKLKRVLMFLHTVSPECVRLAYKGARHDESHSLPEPLGAVAFHLGH